MKNIIALVIALFTVHASYAATVTWGSNDSIYKDGNALTSGSAFLFLVESGLNVNATPSVSANGGGANWSTTGVYTNSYTQINAGGYFEVTKGNIDYYTNYKDAKTTGATYYVIVTTQTADSLADITDGYYMVTEAQGLFDNGYPATGTEADSDGNIDWFYADGNDTDAWKPVAPEPTVLALLALGVAGMALKRKVA